MARGWESKSVESQQEEATRGAAAGRPSAPLTPAARAAQQERRTLELARARTRADLETATRPAQRHMLLQALAAIDARLAGLAGNGAAPGG